LKLIIAAKTIRRCVSHRDAAVLPPLEIVKLSGQLG
jgi:hypothetical protein